MLIKQYGYTSGYFVHIEGISYYFDHGHPNIGAHVDTIYDVIENSALTESSIIQVCSEYRNHYHPSGMNCSYRLSI